MRLVGLLKDVAEADAPARISAILRNEIPVVGFFIHDPVPGKIQDNGVGIAGKQIADGIVQYLACDRSFGADDAAHVKVRRTVSIGFQKRSQLHRIVHAAVEFVRRIIVVNADDQGFLHDSPPSPACSEN